MELVGKTILVTGASSGIGREIALMTAYKGATVVVTGRNQERLNETFNCLAKDKGQSHQQIIADLGNDEQIEQLEATIDEEMDLSDVTAEPKEMSREDIIAAAEAEAYEENNVTEQNEN